MSRVTGLAACDWNALMCLDKRVSVVGRTQEQRVSTPQLSIMYQ
jgi:hypothetical protein